MEKETLRILERLSNAFGPSGFEEEVRDIIEKELRAISEIEYDKIGSIICRKKGTSEFPKIMLAAHMDEIGFMVSNATKEGFVKIINIGGWWGPVVISQRVVIRTRNGDVSGIVGSKPPHMLEDEERKKALEVKELFVDVGASSEKELQKKFRIRIGDGVIPDGSFNAIKNNRIISGKAFDDRVGCALMIDVLKKLKSKRHPNTVFGVGTVQEEVGLKGATTSANMIKPDVAFVLEVGLAGDTPGAKQDESRGKLGKGPQIVVKDSGMIATVKLRNYVIDVAEKNKIPHQLDVVHRGMTDGSAIHVTSAGVPAVYIGVPCRYIHSPTSLINTGDYDNALKLVMKAIEGLDKKKVETLI